MKISKNIVKQRSATYSVENVVVSVKLHQDLPLDKIAKAYKDAEFNTNKFPGICVHLTAPNPKSTVLIFGNGKCVITGLKFSKDVPKVIEKIVDRFKAINIEITQEPEYEVVNVVTSINLKQRINLDEASLLLTHSIYEPEVFPGLIFRVEDPKSVFLIFSSGKVVLTGIKSEEQIVPCIKFLGKNLKDNGLLE
ncbi:MAG: TATA-box-binding protein [Promethearchaeota archaeon]